MASLVDPTNVDGNLKGLVADLTEAVKMDAPAEIEPDHTPANNTIGDEQGGSPEVPKKYQGKKLADVIDMHRNLETAYGRMANDLGNQRKTTDALLDLKRTDDLDKNSPVAVEVSAEGLLENPTQALNEYLDARDAANAEQTDSRIANMEAQLGRQRFVDAHPDFKAVSTSSKFREYINASPLRTRAAKDAGKGNWQSATELMDDFKRDNDVSGPSAAEAAKAAAQKAGLTKSGNQSTGKAGGGKKIYRRADLIQLKLTQPEVYAEAGFQAEILLAYQEGRVK